MLATLVTTTALGTKLFLDPLNRDVIFGRPTRTVWPCRRQYARQFAYEYRRTWVVGPGNR